MSILGVIGVLIVVGVLLWLLSFVPMDSTIKSIIWGLTILAVVLWLLSALLGVNIPGMRLR